MRAPSTSSLPITFCLYRSLMRINICRYMLIYAPIRRLPTAYTTPAHRRRLQPSRLLCAQFCFLHTTIVAPIRRPFDAEARRRPRDRASYLMQPHRFEPSSELYLVPRPACHLQSYFNGEITYRQNSDANEETSASVPCGRREMKERDTHSLSATCKSGME